MIGTSLQWTNMILPKKKRPFNSCGSLCSEWWCFTSVWGNKKILLGFIKHATQQNFRCRVAYLLSPKPKTRRLPIWDCNQNKGAQILKYHQSSHFIKVEAACKNWSDFDSERRKTTTRETWWEDPLVRSDGDWEIQLFPRATIFCWSQNDIAIPPDNSRRVSYECLRKSDKGIAWGFIVKSTLEDISEWLVVMDLQKPIDTSAKETSTNNKSREGQGSLLNWRRSRKLKKRKQITGDLDFWDWGSPRQPG